MWPWEHAIVGYLVYSLVSRLYYRESPDGPEALAAVIASVLPDVIDKPLAWEFEVFETGYALGHSIFFAVPLGVAAGLLARSVGRTRAGIAFAIGYLLHLPSDILDGYLRGGVVYPEIVLWPVATVPTRSRAQGLFDQFFQFFARYRNELAAGDLSTYRTVQIALALGAVLVWLIDGAPVLRECLAGVKRLLLGRSGRNDRSKAGPGNRD
ncbi:metal-dependent hydrolase [Halopiger aswanensis]|uniref:LexA-binding, inner membrane-associated putative hydrolase n=1 Tax=Halopiger aswanensis TaxID=148449 RepID=A0A3R7GXN4_9EURY|nr:metal-dependent hydrolase [Halopiger aswanensis]RKD97409.1 LexA-binding, inner membrane-associated putative hydrolase [Halopiger aswanensis]